MIMNTTVTPAPTSAAASPALVRTVLTRFTLAPLGLMTIFFLPAGTWRYWEAWLYTAVLCIPLCFAVWYLLKTAPDLLERRMRLREKETEQRRIVSASLVFFLLAFILPGIDHRFGWSEVPVAVVLIANALVLAGYLFILLVFRTNHYASRIIEVEADQQVIDTGPYAVVRHPMYVGTLLMYLASPLALGSYWAFPFALPTIWVIVARIAGEEELLVRDLPGYAAYRERVRYRLIPGVW
jgi:protein-S-isoprenylcysteine O-methyltransferase Ste14